MLVDDARSLPATPARTARTNLAELLNATDAGCGILVGMNTRHPSPLAATPMDVLIIEDQHDIAANVWDCLLYTSRCV